MGQRVAFSHDPHSPVFEGTWRQHATHPAAACIPFGKEADYDKICSTFINPLTACGFIDMCQKKEVGALVQDAACSNLGKMVVKLAIQNGIETINIV